MSMLNVIGLGYIGLPTALMFARSGLKVVGTDCNQDLVSSLRLRKTDLYRGRVWMSSLRALRPMELNLPQEYQVTDRYILAVPTPYQ